jgi:hypothetical protein
MVGVELFADQASQRSWGDYSPGPDQGESGDIWWKNVIEIRMTAVMPGSGPSCAVAEILPSEPSRSAASGAWPFDSYRARFENEPGPATRSSI